MVPRNSYKVKDFNKNKSNVKDFGNTVDVAMVVDAYLDMHM